MRCVRITDARLRMRRNCAQSRTTTMIKNWIKKLIREVIEEDRKAHVTLQENIDASIREGSGVLIVPAGIPVSEAVAQRARTILGTPEYKKKNGTKIDFSPLHQPAPINFGDPDAKVVADIAERVRLPVLWFKPEQSLIRFGDASMFIDVWYSKMTVATNIKHPTKGWNRLYRKHVSLTELEKIMAYPRAHTGKGYRTK
jgi:hypothetical protein